MNETGIIGVLLFLYLNDEVHYNTLQTFVYTYRHFFFYELIFFYEEGNTIETGII